MEAGRGVRRLLRSSRQLLRGPELGSGGRRSEVRRHIWKHSVMAVRKGEGGAKDESQVLGRANRHTSCNVLSLSVQRPTEHRAGAQQVWVLPLKGASGCSVSRLSRGTEKCLDE